MRIRRIRNLFRDFTESEKSGGLVLLGCTLLSILIANSQWGESYTHFWHRYLDLSFGPVNLKYSIEHWINDGLMAIFFLLVGLEIEREVYVGELSNIKNAMLPIAAAIGGMVVPVAIYIAFNAGTPFQHGFGIPMATDIAFALGMLSLAGSRVPPSLKVFLTALAIIDDLGAILIIAIFYSTGISWVYLGAAIGIFVLMMVLNKARVHKLFPYLMLGAVMWYCMLQSGVHATLAGVLTALAIPFNKKDDDNNISYDLQHALHKPVAYAILPLFALANTSIILSGNWLQGLGESHSLGIIVGLLVGKPLGIVLFAVLLVALKWGKLPFRVRWKHIIGAGFLGGIGFTMSIFISNLAFKDAADIQEAKIAVLAASVCATVIGLVVLFSGKRIHYVERDDN